MAKSNEEEDLKRTAEQKRIREEKDRLDREQSQQANRTESSAGIEKPQRKGFIDTGRSGGIGNTINIFNKSPESEPAASAVQRVIYSFSYKKQKLNKTTFQKEPIKLPKQPVVEHLVETSAAEPQPREQIPQPIVQQQQQQQQPDVIPLKREQAPPPEIIETLPPPAAFENTPNDVPTKSIEWNDVPSAAAPIVEEQIYSNINYDQAPDSQLYGNENNSASGQTQASEEERMAYVTALIGSEQHDLSEYIEDTGLKAIALYDYEATAEDEISFDPNDIISHIEQVSVTLSAGELNPLILSILSFRSTKDGGVDCAKIVMDSFQPIMWNCSNNKFPREPTQVNLDS